MKLNIFFTLILINSFFSVSAQIDTVLWQNCLGTDNGLNRTYSVEKSENSYLFGISIGQDGPGVSNYHGGNDAWIVNTDQKGNVIWEKCFGGSAGDSNRKIIKITDNTFYLINNTDSKDGDIQNTRNGHFWIVKINSIGEILWENCYGGSINGEGIQDAILMPDKGLLLMGIITSAGGDISVHYGDEDVWLCRIDSTGSILWENTLGNEGNDNGLKIKCSTYNTILFVGAHEIVGGMIDCPDYGYVQSDVWIAELDMNGNLINQFCYGGKYYDLGYDVIEEENGYIVAAITYSNDRDVSGFHGTPGGTWNDIWVFKIDIFGNIMWQRCLGGSTSDYPVYLTQTIDSGFIIIGNTYSLDGDVTGNHSMFDYYSDIWVIKLTGNGELQWNHCFGGLSTERFWGIHSVLKKDDHNYVIGANANYLSDDVECDLFPNDLQYNAWLLEIKDCDYYKPHVPVITSGPDTVCSTVTATSVYSLDTAKWASGYEWMLIPEEAGAITGDSLSAEITWNLTYEGTAELKARGMNDCGESEWSEAKCVRVHTCLGIEEEETGRPGDKETGRGLEVWPNPASGIVDCRWSMFDGRGDLSLMIYDVFGREVAEIKVSERQDQVQINVESYPPGVYIAVLRDGGGFLGSGKFVVAR